MKNILVLCLLILPAVILTVDNGNKLFTLASEDVLEDELVDVEGENDDNTIVETDDNGDGGDNGDGDGDGDNGDGDGGSPYADATILFTKPVMSGGSGGQLELPAGKLVEFLVGFTNKGEQEFVLETLEASFRYPMDFDYRIQNFSTITYSHSVAPSAQASLAYSFVPSDAFAGRPFGLNVVLGYRDASEGGGGRGYYQTVYNSTVSITEVEEGLDTETFFLYVFLVGLLVLLLVLGQQFLISKTKGKGSGKRSGGNSGVERKIERGTGGGGSVEGVDYEWLPKEIVNQLSKSPKTPKTSPRQRKVKRSAGFDD